MTRWRNVLVWIMVPFVLVHSVIGHKELRFLYPLIYLLPAIGVLAVDGAGTAWAHRLRRWRASRPLRVTMFAWLGMGKTIYDAVMGNDYNLALVGLLLATTTVLLANILADLAYAWLDPRIEYR